MRKITQIKTERWQQLKLIYESQHTSHFLSCHIHMWFSSVGLETEVRAEGRADVLYEYKPIRNEYSYKNK